MTISPGMTLNHHTIAGAQRLQEQLTTKSRRYKDTNCLLNWRLVALSLRVLVVKFALYSLNNRGE